MSPDTNDLDGYLNDLSTLVAMDSYTYDRDDVNNVVAWLAERMAALGFDVTRYEQPKYGDNLVAVREGTGHGNIVLLGHSDTVFPRGTARPMTIDGDKVLGSGTYDMKGGLLMGIFAAASLQPTDYARLTFLIVSDEEINERPSLPLMQQTMRGNDAVLTLEGARSNGDIVTARKGGVWAKVTAHGKSAHAGVEPEKGRNAIMGLVRKLPSVVALADQQRAITVNVGTIRGGVQANIVPEHAEVILDVRAFEHAYLDEVERKLRDIFAPADDIRFDVFWELVSPPMPRTDEIAHLETLAKRAAAEIGFEVNGASTGGAADAAFAAAEGVPALDGLGPIGGLDHSPDEYILKSSIAPRIAMLARLIALI